MNRKRILKRTVIGLAVAAGLFLLLPALLIVADGLSDNVGRADVIVVLGSKVHESGEPSARLKARLERARELYRQDQAPLIIVSGALGKEGHDEAVVMRRYLVERGVPEDRILTDSAGRNSLLTARNAAALMGERGLKSALVVSQYFHVSRSRLALRKAGVKPVYSAHARHFELRDLYSIPREVLGYYAYLLRPARAFRPAPAMPSAQANDK